MLDNLRLEASEDLEVNCWGGGAIFREDKQALFCWGAEDGVGDVEWDSAGKLYTASRVLI